MLSHFMFWLGLNDKRIKTLHITYKMMAVWACALKNKGFSETTGFTKLYDLYLLCLLHKCWLGSLYWF